MLRESKRINFREQLRQPLHFTGENTAETKNRIRYQKAPGAEKSRALLLKQTDCNGCVESRLFQMMFRNDGKEHKVAVSVVSEAVGLPFGAVKTGAGFYRSPFLSVKG